MTTKTFSHIKEINLYHENEKIKFYRLVDGSWFNPVKGKFITETELDYLINSYEQNGYMTIPVIKDQHLQNKLEEIDHVIDYGMSLDELISKAKNIQILNDKLEDYAVISKFASGWCLMFEDSIINNKPNIEYDILKNVIDNFVRKGYRCEFYDKDWSLI